RLLARPHDHPQRHVHLPARERCKGALHCADAPLHVEQLLDLFLVEHEHQGKSDATSSRSASASEPCAAASGGPRCSGRRGPTTTALTRGSERSHAKASVGISTPRSDAAASNRSRASYTSSLSNSR